MSTHPVRDLEEDVLKSEEEDDGTGIVMPFKEIVKSAHGKLEREEVSVESRF